MTSSALIDYSASVEPNLLDLNLPVSHGYIFDRSLDVFQSNNCLVPSFDDQPSTESPITASSSPIFHDLDTLETLSISTSSLEEPFLDELGLTIRVSNSQLGLDALTRPPSPNLVAQSPTIAIPPGVFRGKSSWILPPQYPSKHQKHTKSGYINKILPHRVAERKYRNTLNTKIEQLRHALPPTSSDTGIRGDSIGTTRVSKPSILIAAVEYIKSLEKERNTLVKQNCRLMAEIRALHN
ncbi:helix-loop-helix DNA-binding domain-containing protein [Pochonia chlamydosporia 170]|uniref:Helix-loop-helix DNA-binding domain-containing protein n=1 Tax=Pochonia chlamydosporia 170 TaxID=1380566 RepID=A0A179FAI7_METCM|nr:helix-loop-helix DNA-binding domain-containing protein [Pochonia chlamydosporia 170]OAQ62472.1 helix-loop-helix DNA-binding domain-containing protein [Pochonia chlamydosporia 170]